MAVTPPTEEAFLREVDDELRREQAVQMWKRYGRIAVAAVVLFLIAFAVFLWWRANATRAREGQGEQLTAMIADLGAGRKTDASTKIEALIKDGSPAYQVAARFTKAGTLGEKGDVKGAAALYAAIATDDGVADPYRNLALIRQTIIEYDSLAPAQVVERMKPLAIEGNPYFGSAGELTALALIRLNRGVEAGRMLAAVARDKTQPESLRGRAGRLANSLGADVAPDKE